MTDRKYGLPYTIRQTAAVCCAATLAWDYCRDSEVLGMFSIWALALHFVYFQLPLSSRALAYFQPASFIGANVVPLSYLYLLFWKPNFEFDHVEQWDLPLSTVIIRCVFVYFAPLFFHALDITVNQAHLITSFQTKPKKFMLLWSFFAFGLLGLIFEFSCPESEELIALNGIPSKLFIWRSKVISTLASLFAYFLLYMLILRRSFLRKQKSKTF